jgi:hypothetical protein
MRDDRMLSGESHAPRVEPPTDSGLFKTECTGRGSPFLIDPLRTINDVEYAMMEWVDWFNNRRPHSPGVSRRYRPQPVRTRGHGRMTAGFGPVPIRRSVC